MVDDFAGSYRRNRQHHAECAEQAAESDDATIANRFCLHIIRFYVEYVRS